MLTAEKLDRMKPGIFDSGTLVDSPDEFNLAGTGNEVRWVAVRGAIHDWAIYAQNPHYGPMNYSEGKVERQGDKITNSEYIKKLVPCDDEAFEMYRY